MYEAMEKSIDFLADMVNKVFLFQFEWKDGVYIPIGKVAVAFIFIVVSLYLILDTFGILGGDE